MDNAQKAELRSLVRRYSSWERAKAVNHISRLGFVKGTVRKYWQAINEKEVR